MNQHVNYKVLVISVFILVVLTIAGRLYLSYSPAITLSNSQTIEQSEPYKVTGDTSDTTKKGNMYQGGTI